MAALDSRGSSIEEIVTVAGLGKTYFEVALIPHTSERTTLGALRVGEAVSVKVDIVAKYVERFLRKS